MRSAACKTDVVGAYVQAFREQGLLPGLYFSILDLTQGIGRKRCTPEDKEYIKGQITELLTGYGEIPFLLVDGWAAPWGGPSYEALPFAEVDSWVKALQPDCLLINIGSGCSLDHTDMVLYENKRRPAGRGLLCGPWHGLRHPHRGLVLAEKTTPPESCAVPVGGRPDCRNEPAEHHLYPQRLPQPEGAH